MGFRKEAILTAPEIKTEFIIHKEKIAIDAERYEELLKAEIKLNILKEICETENYISIADVKRIIEAGGKKND